MRTIRLKQVPIHHLITLYNLIMTNKHPTNLSFKEIPAEIRQLYAKQKGKANRKKMKRFIKNKFTEIVAFSEMLSAKKLTPNNSAIEIAAVETVPHARPSGQLIKELQKNYISRPTIIDEPGDE